MGAPRRRLFVSLFTLAMLGALGSAWRVKAQTGTSSARPPVQTLKERVRPAPATSGDRGTTYHALESEATRATTTFTDAVAITERAPDGHLATRLADLAGNEMSTFRVHRVDATRDSLEFSLAGGTAHHAARRAGLRPTLDWGNQQAYSLWKDRSLLDGSSLEWQDTLMRPAGAQRRDVNAEARQADTEWPGGISTTVTRKIGTHISYITNRQTTGVVFIGSLKKEGVEVGFSQWWPQEQTFAWSFPGLTDGYVNVSRLQQVGGWPLTPDMAWISTQNLAFYRFHTAVNARNTIGARQGGWIEKLGALITPSLFANEPGCDYLHWLDQSVFRPCCDMHDACYEAQKPQCTSSSWWRFWDSWTCDLCNTIVYYCFATGGTGHALVRFP